MNTNQSNTSLSLPIMEHFYTIQGEGNYTGRAAYFIRIAGCDVGCVWCDVKESWEAQKHKLLSIATLLEEIKKTPTEFVVITGGEPAMYDLNELINTLHAHNYEVAIETSGCYELKGNIDWYCFSPKKFKEPVAEAYDKADELKVVIFHPSDIEWAETHAEKVKPSCKLYLQTEWSKQNKNLPIIVEYVKNHPKWRISLQTHKYLDIP